MRVLLATFGSRGDVQPVIALALGLRAAGHAPTVAAPPNFAAAVARHGLVALPLGRDSQAFLGQFGTNVWAALPVMRAELAAQFAALEGPARAADVIVSAAVEGAGSSWAEALGKPYRYVAFSPSMVASRAHPAPMCPWQRLPGWANALTWRANDLLWNRLYRETFNRERARLGLAPVARVWGQLLARGLILASEPAIAPMAPEPPEPAAQTGAFFLADDQA